MSIFAVSVSGRIFRKNYFWSASIFHKLTGIIDFKYFAVTQTGSVLAFERFRFFFYLFQWWRSVDHINAMFLRAVNIFPIFSIPNIKQILSFLNLWWLRSLRKLFAFFNGCILSIGSLPLNPWLDFFIIEIVQECCCVGHPCPVDIYIRFWIYLTFSLTLHRKLLCLSNSIVECASKCSRTKYRSSFFAILWRRILVE